MTDETEAAENENENELQETEVVEETAVDKEVEEADVEEADVEAETETESEDAPIAEALDPETFAQQLRMIEALLFAAVEPLDRKTLVARMPDGAPIDQLLEELTKAYEKRGINLSHVAGAWAFRTAADLHYLLQEHRQETRKLSRAALETLAIIAYHQPVTRAEVEEVRGVSLSKGTLDLLMEIGWVRLRGRRRTPGRPVTYGVTDQFLDHFGLSTIKDLPGLDELKAAGLLEGEVSLPLGLHPENAAEPEDPIEEGDEGGDLESLAVEIPEEEDEPRHEGI